ncbi:MAG: EAL domain-containing protein [Chloroflexi bacterium]|nr:EAL domain-containing protein [Chloroflexota bacterium]
MPQSLRLLVVEDSEEDAGLVLQELRRAGYAPTFKRVQTGPELSEALNNGPWDVVISGRAAPGLDTLAALRIVREHDPAVPFVVIADRVDEVAAVEATRAGARDYLLKQNLSRLPRTVKRELAETENLRRRAAAEQELVQERIRTALVAQIAGLLGSTPEPDTVFEEFARRVGALIPSDGVTVLLYDPEEGALYPAFTRMRETVRAASQSRFQAGESLVKLLGSRRAVVSGPDDATVAPEFRAIQSAIAGAASSLLAPLVWQAEPVGLLVLQSRSSNAFDEEKRQLAEQIAANISGAVASARQKAALHRQAAEAKLLADISRAATAGLDIAGLARRFLEMVRARTPFDRGALRMVDAATGGLGSGAAVGLGADLPLPAFRSRAVTEAVALGRLVVNTDAEPEEPSTAAPLAQLGLRSSLTLPLISDEHVVGVVSLRRLSPDGFSQDEIDFLTRACGQIAPAVDNARLLSEISTLASTVENSPDFICSADLHAKIQYLNPAGRDLVGLAADYDITQLTWADFFGTEDQERLQAGIASALGRGPWTSELRLKTRDESAVPVEALVVPNYHRNGALMGVTVSARNIADRKRSEEELHRLATTDTLTGLLNRRQFMMLLDQAVRLAVRRRTQGTLVYLDLDGFKYVNDTHGHTAGDQLLIAVSKTLRVNVRGSDVIARTGGDEFVVILHDAGDEDGFAKASQLVQTVSQTFAVVGNERVNTTCSAGVVCYPIEGTSAEDLVAFADLAMYRAKDAGRNRAYRYDPLQGGRELVSSLQRTRRMILDAVSQNRLRLYWQPIVSVETRQPFMHEVLVRLADAEGRLYAPMEFIPQAETLDLIHVIDQRVVELSFDRWRRYADSGRKLRLSINLSARSLDGDMAGFLIDVGQKKGVKPESVAFEITETATWRGGPQTEEFARLVTSAGFRMAIDDFGSGATSFKQIRRLPFHYLKLDGSLVENLRDGRPDRDFVRSLSGLAHALGVEIIAEFVQDEETMQFLHECGVEYAQGYFVARPSEFPETPVRVPAS